MTVNELARAAGVDPGKVRYYARRGLLPARREPGNGYRSFDTAALARLRFIAGGRALGFSLQGAGPIAGARPTPAARPARRCAPCWTNASPPWPRSAGHWSARKRA